jgi:hypothetical protein
LHVERLNLKTLLKRIPPAGGAFLLAAIGPFALSRYATDTSHTAGFLALLVTVIAVASVALAIATGYAVEQATRSKALDSHRKLLQTVGNFDRHDFLQRTTRDYLTVTGRLSWYLSDIAWILATVVVAVASLIHGFVFYGAAAVCLLLFAAWTLWNKFSPAVISSRRNTVETVNAFLSESENLRHLRGIDRAAAHALRKGFALRAVDVLWRGQADSLGSKAALSFYMKVLVTVALVGASVFGPMLTDPKTLGFILGGLLTVAGAITTLTLGLAGYVAQKISFDRLEETKSASSPASVVSLAGEVEMPALTNELLGVQYKSTRWALGKVSTLAGPSGIGKTQFLLTLSRCAGVLYFPRTTQDILKESMEGNWQDHVEQATELAVAEGLRCVILDEVGWNLPPEEAVGFGERIRQKVNGVAAVILVDHRVAQSDAIRFEDLAIPGV